MVKLNNNWIIITDDEVCYFPLKVNLTKIQGSKSVRLKNGRKVTRDLPDIHYYFIDDSTKEMYIPIGLYSFIAKYFETINVIDERTKCPWNLDSIIDDKEKYKNLLENITLRDEQLTAIRKVAMYHRGILQLPTGSGKTEIMCGIVEYIKSCIGYYPTVLILEPTLNLVKSTIKRFKKYGIPAQSYSETRSIMLNTVNICHPASLNNDIEKDSNLLKDINILLGDESHHFNSESFRKPTYNTQNLYMSIGLSASAISQEHIGLTELSDYEPKEVWTFSATGPLLMNIVTANLVGDRLAEPVLLMMKYHCNEELETNDPSNWHDVMKTHLESENRNILIANIAKFFYEKDRKTLILVNTIRWSQALLKTLWNMDIPVGASYGSNKFEIYNGYEFISDTSVLKDFESGKLSVLIGTTHLYEGADIPNLDTIILAFGGNGERTQIQGVGRALRLTKNGKYAYIVDFTDEGDIVLSKHSRNRLNRYINNIGVPKSNIFYNVELGQLEEIFKKLENI